MPSATGICSTTCFAFRFTIPSNVHSHVSANQLRNTHSHATCYIHKIGSGVEHLYGVRAKGVKTDFRDSCHGWNAPITVSLNSLSMAGENGATLLVVSTPLAMLTEIPKQRHTSNARTAASAPRDLYSSRHRLVSPPDQTACPRTLRGA
ncbi:unnamed protein product [Mycena citricolor]|uniref:Uncharacterized protein n=1 Tax=Mycena citricolor TaxID=2018698 RepID=A0AAD2HBZ8_9AGAR|nr:unnamed protein product [Mycena citricolor]